MTSQATIRADIEAELGFEPSLDAAGIGVAVSEGVATLSGHVPSYAQKFAAEHAASRVKGVKAVVEKIEVRLAFETKDDDEALAKRAVDLLSWNVFIPANSVHVKVEKGWVTMTGEVDWQYQKHAASNAVHRLNGLHGVSDLITIRHQVLAGDVKERITQAYRRNADFDSSHVSVGVKGGTVTLSGSVRAWNDRGVAETAAWSIPGVSQVVDDLMVA